MSCVKQLNRGKEHRARCIYILRYINEQNIINKLTFVYGVTLMTVFFSEHVKLFQLCHLNYLISCPKY